MPRARRGLAAWLIFFSLAFAFPALQFPLSASATRHSSIFLLIRGKMFDDSREDRTARAPRTPGFWGSESMVPDLPGGPGVLAVSVLRRNVTNGESPSCSFFYAGAGMALLR